MEDKTPLILIVLAGLVVGFVIWKRAKDEAGGGAGRSARPGFGAAVGGSGDAAAPSVPVDAPITRGVPPSSSPSAPVGTAPPSAMKSLNTARATKPTGPVNL